MTNLPPLTEQPILHVDATPDDDYPLRILRAHRENCNCKWVCSEPNPLLEAMNEMADQRAAILDRAIETLELALKDTED